MSNLYPGGCRINTGYRIFSEAAIERATRRRANRDHGSIAQRNRHTLSPHEHRREIARRQRQQATTK